MNKSVYIETTVISYLAAKPSRDLVIAAHQQITKDWWIERRKSFSLYISELVVREVSSGDTEAAKERLNIIKDLPLLELNEEALYLANMLVEKGPIPYKAGEDALHIAIATVHGIDFLLTWNCRHIANAEMRKGIALLCSDQGYEVPVISTPEEFMGG